MKKNYIMAGALAFTLAISGCSKFLDQVPDDRLTMDETFRNRTTAERFLANTYSYLPREWSQRFVGNLNSGAWTGGSDEGEYLWGFVESNNINIGSWDARSGFVQAFWRDFYRGIRSATIFIANIDQASNDITEAEKTRYKAEARALRAMYYFYLTRIYGPVPILGDEVTEADAPSEEVRIPRNSMDECVAFIVSELDRAAADLPVTPVNERLYNNLTRGVALAFKARMLLQAASPLYNGNTDYADLKNADGKQLINQSYDENKWKMAADAYKAFIDQFVPSTYTLFRKNDGNGQYSAFLSCRDVMLENYNSEIILGRPDDDNARNYETTPYHNGGPSEVRASGGLGATQTMVDAFFMANGHPIDDPNSGYMESGTSSFRAPDDNQDRETYNQWVNREPRFYVNITYDNRKWTFGDMVTRLYYRGNSGKGISNDFCPTGYVVRKGAKTSDWRQGLGVIPLYRLANVYLDYVEALNEYDPGNPDILFYLNEIRQRAGIPGYGESGLEVPQDQAAMRAAIRQERQVELAFENARFFDTRRWKIAEQTDDGPAIGLNIDAELPEFYNKVPFETRVFNKRHYFFPIPEGDINNNPLLVQNTGW